MEESYINLINAIILQAFKDYKQAAQTLRRNPNSDYAQYLMEDVIRFCRSSWLTFLTDVDGEWLIKRMKIFSEGGRNNGRNSKQEQDC